jgi:hypothetical protein
VNGAPLTPLMVPNQSSWCSIVEQVELRRHLSRGSKCDILETQSENESSRVLHRMQCVTLLRTNRIGYDLVV